MNCKEPLTPERFRDLVTYDSETGLFWWRLPEKGRQLGSSIGSRRKPDSYIRVRIGDERYYAHRLVWLYVHGRWPSKDVDHINGDRSDNRLCNLREASMSDNQANRRVQRNSSTGLKGIHQHFDGRWCAQIKVRGTRIHLGLFGTPEAAHAAYGAAAKKHFGEFAKL